MTSVLIRDRRGDTQTQSERPCEDRAETGVTQLHGRECLEPAEAGRGKDRFSPGAFRGRAQNSGPQNYRGIHFSCAKLLSWWKFATAVRGLALHRAADQG